MITKDQIKKYLKEKIAEAMYMEVDEIEDEQLFSDFGLESTTLVKIVEKLCSNFNICIEVREFLPHQTVDKATEFIHEKTVDLSPN